jgi:hypothetical protein
MTKRFAISLVAGLALAIFAQTPQATSQMSLGTVTLTSPLQSCPTSVTPPDRGFDPNVNMVCTAATLSSCPNNDDLTFVYGVAPPATGTTPKGTIVLFSGDGGHEASDGANQLAMVESYVANGFQVVQIAWGWPLPIDWEFTNVTSTNNPASILNAACRPASFLNWVRNGISPNIGKGIWATYKGGMCAHGHSAGSAALAYALAWYNAGASTTAWGSGYLDKGVFTSGPVFSDIRQGCQVPNGNTTFICQNSPEQTFCKGWDIPQDPPGSSLEYTTHYKTEVNDWSGNNAVQNSPACANNARQTHYDATWYSMSILYMPPQGLQPSFTYPSTALSAWLCETTAPGVQGNNAPSQAQLYWGQFTNQQTQFSSLSVNAITGCPSTEDVLGGTVPDANPPESGADAILKDMKDSTNGCVRRHF